jgi:uncharacterized protein involved in outer membrane biogenesis
LPTEPIMRRLFRWLFRIVLSLILLAVILAVAAILLADIIAREILVSRVRSETGMEAKISAVHVGLLSPTISIEGFKLYNTPDFGGSVCLDMPELHIEYDPAALRARRIHFTLMRFDLAQLSLVVDKQGRMNLETVKELSKKSQTHKKQWDKFEFAGIDTLNVTLGTLRQSDLASGREAVTIFGVKNLILHNVKTAADLFPWGLASAFHGTDLDGFLKHLITP